MSEIMHYLGLGVLGLFGVTIFLILLAVSILCAGELFRGIDDDLWKNRLAYFAGFFISGSLLCAILMWMVDNAS